MNKHLNLVAGGTGKTGRRVVERLQNLGLPFRAGSRSAQPAFDWEDRQTWGPCLEGVTQAYVTYSPDFCVPGALDTVQSFFHQAVDAGVKKLVLLSGRGEAAAEDAERALKSSGADWTILRCSFFCQNFSENFFLDPVLAGELALPVGPVAEPFVDAEDIADVAVASLIDDRHSGQLYELTGPRAITFATAIDEIARATGRDVRFFTVSPEAYRAALLEAHVPENIVELVLYLFSTVLDGRNEPVADGVQRALGRPPRDFKEYVQRTAPPACGQHERAGLQSTVVRRTPIEIRPRPDILKLRTPKDGYDYCVGSGGAPGVSILSPGSAAQRMVRLLEPQTPG